MSNKTILFADDSATMRTIVEKTFLAEPFDVVTVPSGEAAIGHARELRPNVIIVDAGMAGVSGYDVCKAVREDAVISRTPIIIMSGVSNLYDEARGASAGVTEHVKKPFDTGQLIQLVSDLSDAAAAETAEAPTPIPVTVSPQAVSSLDSLSSPPLETLDEVSEASESILPEVELEADEPLEADDAPGAAPSLSGIDVEEPAHPRTGTGTQEFGRPPIDLGPEAQKRARAESVDAAADFGEVSLDVPDADSIPAAPEVSPIELDDAPKAEPDSASFQVGTLAELAQMDGRGRPISPEPLRDAIDIETQDAPGAAETPSVRSIPIATPVPPAGPAPTAPPPAAAPTVREPTTPAALRDTRAEASIHRRADAAAKDVAGRVEGITVEQAEAIQTLTREVIERIVWEVVPDLAEVIIKEELKKLLEE